MGGRAGEEDYAAPWWALVICICSFLDPNVGALLAYSGLPWRELRMRAIVVLAFLRPRVQCVTGARPSEQPSKDSELGAGGQGEACSRS